VLVARNVVIDDESAAVAIAQALREAAAWVGCTDVRIEQAASKRLAGDLRRALRANAPDGAAKGSALKERAR
jgi:hypothetical protein